MGEVLTQDFGHVGRGLKAPCGFLRVQPLDDRHEPLGDLGVGLADRARRVLADTLQDGHRAAGAEGCAARAHGIEDAAEAEQVGAAIDGLTAGLLWGHVLRRPRKGTALRQAGVVCHTCQAEVGDLHPLDAIFQQDVCRLDVAVDEPLGMRGGQTRCRLHADAQDLGELQRPSAIEPILERHARHVMHDQIRPKERLFSQCGHPSRGFDINRVFQFGLHYSMRNRAPLFSTTVVILFLMRGHPARTDAAARSFP